MPLRVRNNVVWAPGAKRTSGPYTGGPAKGLLHATITPSTVLPGYRNQSTAPHETILWNPTTKRATVRTHLYFDNYAKALGNDAGGVQTNKDTVIQHELAGYLGRATPRGEFDILTAPDIYWEQVADIVGPVWRSWGVKNVFSRSFASGVTEFNRAKRMSGAEWDGFNGVCTHADCPENSHWDSPLGARVKAILSRKIWPLPTPIVKDPLMDHATFKRLVREVIAEEETARQIFTAHPVMKEPATGKRVAPSRVIELGAGAK